MRKVRTVLVAADANCSGIVHPLQGQGNPGRGVDSILGNIYGPEPTRAPITTTGRHVEQARGAHACREGNLTAEFTWRLHRARK